MKLFTKYNRINIAATIFTFLVGSIAFYFVLHYVLIRQLDETLRAEEQEINRYIETHHQIPDIQNTKHQWTTIEKTNTLTKKEVFKNITLLNTKENEEEAIRQIIFTTALNGTLYKITVNKSKVETEDILQLIILVTMCMIALILLINLYVNRKIINRLWQPFYTAIEQIKSYHINDRQSLSLPNQNIEEFNLLNESLNTMTKSIYNDYQALKSFTENASHEMQTPLAVIRSKTDILLQQTDLTETSIKHILGIEDGITKLSRLHQSLLLLTKIENLNFSFTEKINISTIIQQKIEEKREIFQSKLLSIEENIIPVEILFHHHFAEILVNNLLTNTIRYSPENGKVEVVVTKEKLVVKNTAINGQLDANKILTRFYKAQQNQEGIGLGLAIVNEICKVAGFSLQYSYADNQHIFTIFFNQ